MGWFLENVAHPVKYEYVEEFPGTINGDCNLKVLTSNDGGNDHYSQ